MISQSSANTIGIAWRLLFTNPRKFVRLIVRLDSFEIYWNRVENIPPAEYSPDLRFVRLTDEELANLPPAFSIQRERSHRLGFNSAFGVYVGNTLGHVSWFMSAEHDRLRIDRILKLRKGEVEIAHCLTAPEFRGRGLYRFGIQSLAEVARRSGIRDVYMIVVAGNTPSSKGILSAGLVPLGKAYRLIIRRGRWRVVIFRGHRVPFVKLMRS